MSMFFFSSRIRHTRCALVTGVQTCALPIYATGYIRGSAPEDGRVRRACASGRRLGRSCRSVFRGDRGRKPAASEPEGDVDQQDKYRHLDERTDDRGEGDRGRKAEGGEGHSDREFEIIARRGERTRGSGGEMQAKGQGG